MGIKHLNMVKSYLEKVNIPVSRTRIRDDLSIEYNMVGEVLSYLLKIDIIIDFFIKYFS